MRLHYTLNHFTGLCLLALITVAANAAEPPDSVYKSWYFTPTAVIGRQPLDHPRTRHYVKITHPSPGLAVIEDINPAGITTNTTRVYFSNGLITLSTQTNRWGESYDSIWFKPDGPDKFLVTQRTRGVNPYLPCKYLQYTFRNDLLAEIVCYADSIRAGANQEGVAHYVFERFTDPDRRGLIRTETFFTEIDAPAFSRIADCHKVINDYDTKGNLLSRSIYDQDDKPMLDRYGVFRTKYKYDGDDNQTEAIFYDAGERITINTLMHEEAYRDYRRGFLSEESFCVDLTRPAISMQLGGSVSFVGHKYDRDGNETETAWFDRDHDPVNNIRNFQKIEYLYSPGGMLIQENWLSLNRSREIAKVYLTRRYTRDEKGRIVNQHFETNTGVLVSDPDNGAPITKYSYDAWGRIHSTTYWQNDSTPMLNRFGYHAFINRYDDNGQLAERQFYDEHGALSIGAIGYSKEMIQHNAFGQPAEVSYFAGNNPVTLTGKGGTMAGFHRVSYHYDQLNRPRSMEFFDQAGNPVNARLLGSHGRVFNAREIDLDYTGDLLTAQTLKDTSNDHPSTTLDCSAGECISFYGITALSGSSPSGAFNPVTARTYHGLFRSDSIFDNQIGFIGHDSLLIFIGANWGSQTDIGCAEYYRVATVNKYYQFEGRVTDYYMENDSLAATFNYLDGKLEGPVYFYYRNGFVRERGNYHNNDRSGTWEYYYDNGQKERTVIYADGQPPLLQDCYSRNGDILAQNGNGRFEGPISPAFMSSSYEMIAKGNVLNGFPDGQWDLYTRERSGPANTEYFSKGRFRHGISYSMFGKSTYDDHFYSGFESMHLYEKLDHYRFGATCHIAMQPPFQSDLYPQLRTGLGNIAGTGKYKDYVGWIFLAVKLDSAGRFIGSSIRLRQPNADLEKDIREMVALLHYPPSIVRSGKGHPYEKLYILLLGNNEVVIPEELLERQRNPFR